MAGSQDMQHEMAITPLWRQAFRPFFLFGALFSCVAVAVWLGVFTGLIPYSPYGGGLFWHGHEMLFGFVAAIVVGFLLTAVQNWTGIRATHGRSLILLFGLWLAGRLLMLTGAAGHTWLVVVVDMGFLPLAAIYFARLVVAGRNQRNYSLILLLSLLTLANGITHLAVLYNNWAFFIRGMDAAVMLITLLVVIIGGRVIPLFTGSGTQQSPKAALPWLERIALGSSWALALLMIAGGDGLLPAALLAAVFAIAAVANAWRASRWWVRGTLQAPLVWSLHAAYWFVPPGLLLFALHYAGTGVSRSAALHCLTAGAMGSLVLAMIARVALGHSGRPLIPPRGMTLAFLAIALAGVARVLAGLYTPAALPGYHVATWLWVTAYALYVGLYARILLSPRADGKPG